MSSESGSNEMDAGSWIIILMLTCSPFLAFGCVSFTIFCCDCNQDGDVVLLRSGWWVRRRLIERSLVTKTVKAHTEIRSTRMCINSRMPPRRNSLQGADNTTITTKLEHESEYDHSICVICREQYFPGDSISWARNTMYCDHAFHTECIKQWLMKKRSCPCCRYGIIRWEDMYIRCNAWSDHCCGRRSRVLSDKRHRDLLSRCREAGQYCIDHGLVFPFPRPELEEPYEPRIHEMEECLQIAARECGGVRVADLRTDLPRREDNERRPSASHFPVRVPSDSIREAEDNYPSDDETTLSDHTYHPTARRNDTIRDTIMSD